MAASPSPFCHARHYTRTQATGKKLHAEPAASTIRNWFPSCSNPLSLAPEPNMDDLLPSEHFPPVELADSDGLLALGGRLTPEWLLDAYRHGIFPWPVSDDAPIAWWSPDPRAIIELDALHVSRRLRRTLRSGRFQVTCDRDFPGVIGGCASAKGRVGQTWITPAMLGAYTRLFELGHAHSVEAWHEGHLAGGVYGVTVGGVFAGESMFYRVRDASKVALAHLVAHLKARGYRLFDIQQLTPHTARLGATEIPRKLYMQRLAEAVALSVRFGEQLESGMDQSFRG
jgi:leucyl/phenylalanyl-tRNA--protein transferase